MMMQKIFLVDARLFAHLASTGKMVLFEVPFSILTFSVQYLLPLFGEQPPKQTWNDPQTRIDMRNKGKIFFKMVFSEYPHFYYKIRYPHFYYKIREVIWKYKGVYLERLYFFFFLNFIGDVLKEIFRNWRLDLDAQ